MDSILRELMIESDRARREFEQFHAATPPAAPAPSPPAQPAPAETVPPMVFPSTPGQTCFADFVMAKVAQSAAMSSGGFGIPGLNAPRISSARPAWLKQMT